MSPRLNEILQQAETLRQMSNCNLLLICRKSYVSLLQRIQTYLSLLRESVKLESQFGNWQKISLKIYPNTMRQLGITEVLTHVAKLSEGTATLCRKAL